MRTSNTRAEDTDRIDCMAAGFTTVRALGTEGSVHEYEWHTDYLLLNYRFEKHHGIDSSTGYQARRLKDAEY